MRNSNNSKETILRKIYKVRGEQIMLDVDLAQLFGVYPKVLRDAVRRNMARFPEDFMFEMTLAELENCKSQFALSFSDNVSLDYSPMCFTVQGMLMLPSVLKNPTATQVSVHLFRLFVEMRKASNNHLVTQPDSFPFFT